MTPVLLKASSSSGQLEEENQIANQHPPLNTPLGNLLPSEYADVDITSLFPHYSKEAVPRWSRLFPLPYSTLSLQNMMHQPVEQRPIDFPSDLSEDDR